MCIDADSSLRAADPLDRDAGKQTAEAACNSGSTSGKAASAQASPVAHAGRCVTNAARQPRI